MKIPLPRNRELVFHRSVLRPVINGVRQALNLPPTPSNGVLSPLQIRARTPAAESLPPRRPPPAVGGDSDTPHTLKTGLTDNASKSVATTDADGTDAPAPGGTKPDQLSDETMDNIVSSVLMTPWPPNASREISQHTHPLSDHHVRLARLLDAVYKHHFNGSFGRNSIDSVPSDNDLKEVLGDLYGEHAPREFAPRARETLKILYDDFDRLPLLKDIPASQRWRLLVDRVKVDMLAKHGIDPSNPLLCFIFETHPGYAHSVAQGLKFTAECIAQGRELSLGLIKEMAAACGARETHGIGMLFGAYATREGVAAVANLMLELGERYGIDTATYAPRSQVVAVIDGTPHVGAWKGTSDASIEQSQPTNEPLAMLAQQGFPAYGPTRFTYFDRATCTDESVTQALNDFVKEYQERMAHASSSDERLLAAATLYFKCEHLHPLMDANFRVFGKLLPMFLLAKQGEPLTEIYDPNTSDGNSPRELVGVFKEGQAWVKSLSDSGS